MVWSHDRRDDLATSPLLRIAGLDGWITFRQCAHAIVTMRADQGILLTSVASQTSRRTSCRAYTITDAWAHERHDRRSVCSQKHKFSTATRTNYTRDSSRVSCVSSTL